MSNQLSLDSTPQQFIDALKRLGKRRACLTLAADGQSLDAATPELSTIRAGVEANTRDFAGHEGVFLEIGQQTGALLGAFIHKTARGQGAGGVRHWPYSSLGEFIQDGLRLSRGMGRKSALAGLWWGGGKGIIARQPDVDHQEPEYRRRVYRDYGRLITSLRGLYVTAEDVGTRASDMASIYETTRFVTCVPEGVGGSGNPSGATAKGVVCAMQAALEATNQGQLAGKTIAMQGAGNVASFMIEQLLALGISRLIVTDISDAAITALRERHPDPRLEARRVASDDQSIFDTPCDVLAPNALGGVLNPDTIPRLQAKLVCGAANNQFLDDERDAGLLQLRGIPAVPDFVANRMGIVQCANEQYGSLPNDPSVIRHFDPAWEDSVHAVTLRVLRNSQQTGKTPTQSANDLADEAGRRPHPIWPGRGAQIIAALRAEAWHDGGSCAER